MQAIKGRPVVPAKGPGARRSVTPDEIATYQRDGVVCLRQILTAEWVADLADAIDALVPTTELADLSAMAKALLGGAENESAEPDAVPRPNPSTHGGRFLAGVDHWQRIEAFWRASCDSTLGEIAAALMKSQRVHLFEDSVLVKEAGAEERTRWHQDLSYFNLTGQQICTFWAPTDRVVADTGALQFISGSHLDGTLYRPTMFINDEPLPGTEGRDVTTLDAESETVISFEMEPGDITVHHSMTLHAAGPNRSSALSRLALSVRDAGDDARFVRRNGAPLKAHHADGPDGSLLERDDLPCVRPRS